MLLLGRSANLCSRAHGAHFCAPPSQKNKKHRPPIVSESRKRKEGGEGGSSKNYTHKAPALVSLLWVAFIHNIGGQFALMNGYCKGSAVNGILASFWGLASGRFATASGRHLQRRRASTPEWRSSTKRPSGTSTLRVTGRLTGAGRGLCRAGAEVRPHRQPASARSARACAKTRTSTRSLFGRGCRGRR